MKSDQQKLKVLKKLKFGGDSELSVIFEKDNKTGIDFEKAIRNMGRLNPKVKIILQLQDSFARVHDEYAVYADTESNLHLTDA